MVLKVILLMLVSYIIGAVPFGVIIGKLAKGIDIRREGSGNIGAANAFRTLGVIPGSLVLIADILKGAAPIFLAGYLVPQNHIYLINILAGISAVIGHNYSIFLKGKGGKGVATSFGVFLALNWYVALIALGIYIFAFTATKISSVGSLSATLSIPVLMYLFHQPIEYVLFAVLAAIFVFYKHKSNIARIIKGEELKVFK